MIKTKMRAANRYFTACNYTVDDVGIDTSILITSSTFITASEIAPSSELVFEMREEGDMLKNDEGDFADA